MHMKRRSLTQCTPLIAITALAFAFALAAVASASVARTTDTAAAGCKTSGLVVWIDTRGNAAAGSIYYTLKFTNQSGHHCVLHGYPGVSAVDLGGHQLGSAASRDASAASVVNLTNGATASAELRITQVANFPRAACRPAAAAGLHVYPPNQTAAKVVPIPLNACRHTGRIYLRVKPVAGTGR
jgi:hypothetical protein